MRILLVDDDDLLSQAIAHQLTAQRYAVDVASDGELGWSYAQSAVYDLIVLDINLPKLDGINLCQRLRKNKYSNSILLLTAKGDSSDKVMGLDAGADDYVVKPCTIEELCARIRALLRRQSPLITPILEWGNLSLDPGTCEVMYQGELLTLSPKEYGLLELFLRNPQRVFSSSSILEHLWGFDDTPGEETVRTHIKRLRRKLKAVGAEELIDTVYGMGYRLKLVPEPPPAEPATAVSEKARVAAIAVWEKFKPPMLERIAVLDQAVVALESGSLAEELRQAALRSAHKLAGSLGMFGFPGGTEISRDIEAWLQTEVDPKADSTPLKTLITALRQELQHPPKPSSWDEDLLPTTQELEVLTEQKAPLPDVLTTVQEVLNQKRSPQIKVLVIDDDPLILATLQSILPRWGIQTLVLSDPHQVWETLTSTSPDLLILDVDIPHISGIDLCRLIRNESTWSNLPILFLSVYRDPETLLQLYGAGADDYVAKPFTEPEIVTRIFNRLERNRMLRSFADLDPLTGVANRHGSTQKFNRYLDQAQQQAQPLCLAIINLDHFKLINHQYGHDLGDAALKRVGSILHQTFCGEDVVARWGGAEFLIGMYGITQAEALNRLNRVLHLIRQETFEETNTPTPLQITFSGGVAEAPKHGLDLRSLYQAADTAMQQAKAAGCNCIMLTL